MAGSYGVGGALQGIGSALMGYGLRDYEQQQQARQMEQQRAQEQSRMLQVMTAAQGEGAGEQGPAFLKALMLSDPAAARQYGGTYAQMLEQRRRELRESTAGLQYQQDMGAALDQMAALPPEQQARFLATTAARMGPQFANQLFQHSQEQFQQQGQAQHTAAIGAQQTQAQAASLELLERRQRGEAAARAGEMSIERLRQSGRAQGGGGGGGAGAGPAGGAELGALPQGMIWEVDQQGQPRAVALRNTPEWIKGNAAVSASKNARARLAEMRELMDKHGTEQWPGAVKGRMAQLYGSIVSDIAQSRGMGVLQEGERRAVEESFPNPTRLSASVVPGSEAMTRGALDQLEQEVYRLQQRDYAQFGGWPGIAVQAPLPLGHKPYRPAPGRGAPAGGPRAGGASGRF